MFYTNQLPVLKKIYISVLIFFSIFVFADVFVQT